MSMSTVKAHMHSIIRKLRVRNRTEAVVAARAMELTQHTDAPGVLKQAA
jgi:DNA-binding NarL/FixJ family response regulator